MGTTIISRNSIFYLIELNFLPQHRVRNHLKDFQLSLEPYIYMVCYPHPNSIFSDYHILKNRISDAVYYTNVLYIGIH
jgi:hypothetical protein